MGEAQGDTSGGRMRLSLDPHVSPYLPLPLMYPRLGGGGLGPWWIQLVPDGCRRPL